MEAQIAVLSSTGDLRVPAAIQDALGLRPGSRVIVTAKEGRLIAEPIEFDDISSMRGILSSQQGMVEELQQERRQDKW